ncbi:protein LURP-one-related 8-like [Panicum miliaceum]|uniref:Protein LURP-one-related 8-like n=1 Tax=Panicum miliaceum TaxID=4540 RepID=A0A3L6R5U3_PANMI|nr:protein LURP-one-related 8-like [Panicum miliaceum]
MAKVHPNAADPERQPPQGDQEEPRQPPTVLTVWRKSLLFNCHGFTVFDANGDLAFRVDCYAASRRRAEVVLMDVAGKPLLTVRRKRLSLTEHWVIYDGDAAEPKSRPLLSVRRHVSLRSSSKAVAHVTPHASAAAASAAEYVVEGSYGRRACAVRDARGDAVAEVRRKESVGDDVFRLVADPRLGAPLAMGLVITLDEMFGAGRGSARSLLRRTWSV